MLRSYYEDSPEEYGWKDADAHGVVRFRKKIVDGRVFEFRAREGLRRPHDTSVACGGRVAVRAGAEARDVSLYFVHWLADLAGTATTQRLVTALEAEPSLRIARSPCSVHAAADDGEIENLHDLVVPLIWVSLGASEDWVGGVPVDDVHV